MLIDLLYTCVRSLYAHFTIGSRCAVERVVALPAVDTVGGVRRAHVRIDRQGMRVCCRQCTHACYLLRVRAGLEWSRV
jgi:hypothetical protein